MRNRQKTSSGVNRRKFLKSTTLGSITGLTIATPILAKGDNQQYSQMAKRDINSPITPGEIKSTQKRIIRQYFENTGKEHGLARAVPEFPDDISIVAFHYTIDKTGTPRQYVGAVPVDDKTKRTDVEELHQEAEAHASQFSESNAMTTSMSGGYSVDPQWNEVDDHRVTVGRCREGKYTKTCKVYEHQDDNDNVFACTSTVQMIPGQNLANCTSIWENHRLHVAHNWGLNSIGNSTQNGHDPSGSHTGKLTGVSAGISYIGASIGWSFSQPTVTRHDNSNTNHADWLFDWNNNRGDTFVYRLGSKCYFSAQEQKDDKILVVDTDGHFRGLTDCGNYGCSFNYRRFSHNTHLYWAGTGGVT